MVITNRAGRSYYKSGANYSEVLPGTEELSAFGDGHKQGRMKFNVTITAEDADQNAIDLTADMLAGLTDGVNTKEYYITVTAGGSVKASLNPTTTLGSHEDATQAAANWAAAGVAADGVLGKALGASVDVMKISITTAGLVKYHHASSKVGEIVTWDAGTAWDITNAAISSKAACTAQPTDIVYVGLEVPAEELTIGTTSHVLIENSKLTPALANAAANHN